MVDLYAECKGFMNVTDSQKRTALFSARNGAMVQALLRNGAEERIDSNLLTPLMQAVITKKPEVVQALLSVSRNSVSSLGATALQYARAYDWMAHDEETGKIVELLTAWEPDQDETPPAPERCPVPTLVTDYAEQIVLAMLAYDKEQSRQILDEFWRCLLWKKEFKQSSSKDSA